MNNKSFINSIFIFFNCFSSKRKFQFLFLVFLTISASFAELFSLGAIVPFLAAISFPEQLYANSLAKPFILFFSLNSPNEILVPIILGFVLAVLIAALLRVALLWFSIKLSFELGADLGYMIYERVLHQPYSNHINRDSSDVIDGIFVKTDIAIYKIIQPLCNIFSGVFLILGITSILFFINAKIAIFSFLIFAILYLLIFRTLKKQLLFDGEKSALASKSIIKELNEGLGSIRDILIDGSQNHFLTSYKSIDKNFRQSQAGSLFLGQSPRFIMEGLGIILIAFFAYKMSLNSDELITVVPILGLFAFASQRLLPIFQQIFNAITYIQSAKFSLSEILEIIEKPIIHQSKIRKNFFLPFNTNITFKNICFKYKNSSFLVIDKINLKIKKGECIGIQGKTGSGKSTFLDIFMGLLRPSKGFIKIDGEVLKENNMRLWQNHISHVPQTIYLANTSIIENIAFGIDRSQIDLARVKWAAKKACISEEIESWPENYNTIVGERGVKLSGGQRQRLGIARALYKKTSILVLDEATSALDVKTEKTVMSSIYELEKMTIIIVTHRQSTLKKCNSIYQFKNQKLIKLNK
jgi:ATP-binding cassette subfamily B protein